MFKLSHKDQMSRDTDSAIPQPQFFAIVQQLQIIVCTLFLFHRLLVIIHNNKDNTNTFNI